MKSRLTQLAAALPVLFGVTAAHAHPGGHGEIAEFTAAIGHFFSSPFHLGAGIAALAVAAVIAYGLRKSRTTRS
ncbi:MAG TPA: hypothetical protein DCZ07_11670 [Alphaproteobacteria bacterium]|jgi:RimJ/RimL family protein N-acetyltransferase|nr:hypothetical protein [Alphaproteobacteria bacterium]HBC52921.1 hypothetical protein [Alphaproteobacteria bacterium]